MLDYGEMPKISEVKREQDDQRLLTITHKFEKGGWDNTLQEVKGDILANPDWLLDPSIFRPNHLDSIKKLLFALESNPVDSLDDLFHLSMDESVNFAFVMRFLEVFSEKYNFPYVWRGGSLENVDHSVVGTFTFFVGEAKSEVMKSYYSGPRKNPCLIGLPVKAIVDQYKKSGRNSGFIAEHGYDGIFSMSFDIYIHDEVPDGTMIYLPD